MNALQLHGELSYLQGEDLSVTAGGEYISIQGSEDGGQALGIITCGGECAFEMAGIQGFLCQAGFFCLYGRTVPFAYRWRAFKGDNGADMNAGVEFRITKLLNLWFQMNNIFNNKYERWHQYPVYGFNVLGGIIFSFGDKKN